MGEKDELVTQEIKDKELEKTPVFYKSIAGNVFYSRLAKRIDLKPEKPRIGEVIEGSMIITERSSFGVSEKIFPFKRTYSEIPYVEGIAELPNGNVVKLPHSGIDDNPSFKVLDLRRGYIELNSVGNAINKGKAIKVKLRVFDLSNER